VNAINIVKFDANVAFLFLDFGSFGFLSIASVRSERKLRSRKGLQMKIADGAHEPPSPPVSRTRKRGGILRKFSSRVERSLHPPSSLPFLDQER